jgi:hypothetical protein
MTKERKGVSIGEAARVTAIMLDGTKHEGTSVWQALSDRVAFERRYATSILSAAQKLKGNLDEEGNPTEGFDWSLVNEERLAFFAWRVLRRAERPVGDFDDFIDNVEDIELEALEGPADGPADPTNVDPLDADQPSGSSLSSQ